MEQSFPWKKIETNLSDQNRVTEKKRSPEAATVGLASVPQQRDRSQWQCKTALSRFEENSLDSLWESAGFNGDAKQLRQDQWKLHTVVKWLWTAETASVSLETTLSTRGGWYSQTDRFPKRGWQAS